MAINMLQLPAYNVGGGVDFSPVNNALAQVSQSAQFNRQNALQQEQLGMQKERLGMEREQFDAQKQQQIVQRFAGIAQGIDGMQDPAQRQAAWQNLLSQHPQGANLPAIYRDPIQGPKLLMQEAQGFMGKKDQAQIGLIQAQTLKAQREAAMGPERYGKDIKVFQGPDGKVYGVQAGASGELKYHDLSAPGGGGGPLTPSRGVGVVGGEMYDKSTGRTVRSVEDALARGETAKGAGDNLAKLQSSFPKAGAALRDLEASQKIVVDTIDSVLPRISGMTTGLVGSALSKVPGTAGYDLARAIDTIKANVGFDKLQTMRENSPTGGALGQVAVQELVMLQSVIGSLEQAQSPQQITQVLQTAKQFLQDAGKRRAQAFAETYSPVMSNQRTGNSPMVSGERVPRQFTDRLPAEGQAPAGAQGMIPPGAVQLLRGNPTPDIIQQFEAKYGPGSARQFLGGQ